MHRSLTVNLATAISLMLALPSAFALEDQWYFGMGVGTSRLLPKADSPTVYRTAEQGTVGSIIFGRDFDTRSSGQFQFFHLGEAEFDTADPATYSAAEAALLYRFYDSRDGKRGNPIFGASIYGRFGLGYIDRDTELSLGNETPVYFGAGAGVETYVTQNIGIRLEAQYFDTDAAAATVSLVGRFGGLRHVPGRRPPPVPTQSARYPTLPAESDNTRQTDTSQSSGTAPQTDATQLPETAPLSDTRLPEKPEKPETRQQSRPEPAPATQKPPAANGQTEGDFVPDVEIMVTATEAVEPASRAGTRIATQTSADNPPAAPDFDGDGVSDKNDNCPRSTANYPVGDTGCGLLSGIIEGISYENDSITLLKGSTGDLDKLATLLMSYPKARIELVSHTDNTGSEVDQARRSRGRLKSIGTYLVKRGVSAKQLVLRSFAAKRPKFENDTVSGRERNNRVEVIESPQ